MGKDQSSFVSSHRTPERTPRGRALTGATALISALAIAVSADGLTAARAGAAPRSGAHRHRVPAAARAVVPGRVEILRLPSGDADGEGREVWVYHPAIRDSAAVPVVYFLHGYPGSDRDGEGIGLAARLDREFAAGARPFVLVVPSGQSSIYPDSEWADSADGRLRLEHFVVSTLVRAVEGRHRRHRTHRAIAGFSMGGYGAMNLALRHRDLFGQAVSIAGYFHPDDPDRVGGGGPRWWDGNSPDRHVVRARRTRILLIEDAKERNPLIKGEAGRFAELAQQARLHPTVLVAPGGHNWSMVAAEIPAVVRYLQSGW
jgi:S-formylglutathione hydrolase FrmB